MHIQTHVISGWCFADLLQLTPRERMLAMVAASAADLDGLGLLVSIECYAKYHHVLGHNVFFGLLLAWVLAAFSRNYFRVCVLYFALFHLHLILDYFGSGPGWGIRYLWPFSTTELASAYAWPLASWQKLVAACFLLAWTVVIAIRRGRTPLEVILPSVDSRIIQCLHRRA